MQGIRSILQSVKTVSYFFILEEVILACIQRDQESIGWLRIAIGPIQVARETSYYGRRQMLTPYYLLNFGCPCDLCLRDIVRILVRPADDALVSPCCSLRQGKKVRRVRDLLTKQDTPERAEKNERENTNCLSGEDTHL